MARAQPSGLIASFQEHYDDLLRFLTRRLGDLGRAADVAQDTYLRLAKAQDPDIEVRDARAFIFRVAGNLAIDTMRRDRRLASMVTDAATGERVPDPTPSSEAHLLSRERLMQLDQALAQLAPKARLALLYNRVEGLTHAQIAARLGVSESMVAKYIAQALRHCRDRLRQRDEELS